MYFAPRIESRVWNHGLRPRYSRFEVENKNKLDNRELTKTIIA